MRGEQRRAEALGNLISTQHWLLPSASEKTDLTSLPGVKPAKISQPINCLPGALRTEGGCCLWYRTR